MVGMMLRKEDRHNTLQHVLTDFRRYEGEKDLGEGVIPIHQDCNIFVSEADPGVDQQFVLSKGRQAYLVCIEGKLSVSDLANLDTRDAVEVCRDSTQNVHNWLTTCNNQYTCWHCLLNLLNQYTKQRGSKFRDNAMTCRVNNKFSANFAVCMIFCLNLQLELFQSSKSRFFCVYFLWFFNVLPMMILWSSHSMWIRRFFLQF